MGDYGIHCPCIHCESGIYTLDKSVYISSAKYRQLSTGNVLGQSSRLQPHLMDITTIISPYGFWLTTARFHHSSFTTWVGYWILARLLALALSTSVCMDSSRSCSITSFWVVPWPLGTTPISLSCC